MNDYKILFEIFNEKDWYDQSSKFINECQNYYFNVNNNSCEGCLVYENLRKHLRENGISCTGSDGRDLVKDFLEIEKRNIRINKLIDNGIDE